MSAFSNHVWLYVSLTTPAMLAGLGFAAFPIIAHLMSRSARTRRSFPSLELLQQVAAEQARIAKPRHWILLLLRCLAIACIALAFARPVWQSDQSAALASNQSNDVVFLVDTSASMQAKRGGVSRIEFAKVEAARLLDDLRSGRDRAAVVFMGERPTSVFPDLSPNLPALATAVASVEPTFGVAEPQAALALAKQLLRKATGKRRVVILSDMQASNWKAAADAGVSRMLGNNTQVLVVDLVDGPIANVSLGMPRVNPQRPLVGQPVLLTGAGQEPHVAS